MKTVDIPAPAGHAVVVGGSMAGLLAARVLADHFAQVTLVERDRLGEGCGHRRGVPQDRQVHVLLSRGRTVLDRLFPGYGESLGAAGAVPVRLPGDMAMLTPAGWLDRRAAGWTALSASRPLFEGTARRGLRERAGVTILDGHDVTALHASGDRRQVCGVTVRALDDRGAGGAGERLDADLVVVAAGRASHAVRWLTELGLPEPARTRVDPDIAYATGTFRIPAGFDADWTAAMLASAPPSMPRTGYLFPIEDRQWMVAMMGCAGEHPPTDPQGYLAFARSLRHPLIADAIAGAEPTGPIRGHRGTVNQLWHFERMRGTVEGFVVLGDAVCAFNPIYGQGMTAAAVAAEVLDGCLREQRRRRPAGDLNGLARRFQRMLARANADPWMLSTGEDLRFPTTTGVTVTAGMRLQHRYLDRVVAASTRDPDVADVYVRVLGMMDRPTAMFAPHVVAAALRFRPDGRVTAPPPAPTLTRVA